MLARSYSTSGEGATGASSHVPAQITEFRAIFTPHHAGNASPQAGASWIEPDDNTITEYKLEHQLLNEADWTEVRLLHGNNSHYIDAEYDSTYSFRISAINDNGSGLVSAIQNVTVVDFSTNDTVAPVFSGDSDITHSGIIPFNYTKPIATDDIDGVIPVTCNPDKVFNFGENEIFCHAYDSDGNLAETSFTVTVPALDPIDCTIDVMMGSVTEFHPSECDVRYDGMLLDAIPRSMLYGTAEISDDKLAVLITPPETLPDLTPLIPSQAILDHLNITSDEFVPRQAAPESFGLTISPTYGADRPRIDVTVNYTTEFEGYPIGAAIDANLYPLPDGVVITEITVKVGTTRDTGGFGSTPGDTQFSFNPDHLFGVDTYLGGDLVLNGVGGDSNIGFAFDVRTESDGEFDIIFTPTGGSPQTITVKVETDVANTTPSATVTGAKMSTSGSTPPTIQDITVTGTGGTSETHTLQVSDVPPDYNFVSAAPASNLGDVTVSGAESDGTVTITFGLPSVSISTEITGDLSVRYSNGITFLDVTVPVTLTVNPLTVTNITATGTADTTITETITVTNIPSSYSFTNATADTALTAAGVSITGTESNGIITVDIDLPSAQASITGNIVVTYGDGTNTLTSNSAVTLTVNPPNPPTVTNVNVTGSVDTTVTETIIVTNVPTGYSFTNATADAALTAAGVSISGTESRGEITVSIGLPSTQTTTPITGNIIVSYGDGTYTLTSNSTATITVVPTPVVQPLVLLPLQISADGMLTVEYSHALSDNSADFFFFKDTQFTPVPSSIEAGITSPVNTDFAYSLFIGDRSTAFTTDMFFDITMYNTESNVVPNYYASDPTVLVEIPECIDSFDEDRLADGDLMACYASDIFGVDSITISTIQSGNYVLVPRS